MTRIELDVPDEVTVEADGVDLIVDGPNGRVTKRLWFPNVTVSVEDDVVVIESETSNRETASTMKTFGSHIRNMFRGVTDGWSYEMQIVYAHFPMQVRVEDDEVVIENFLGERAPRRAPIYGETEVDIDGEMIELRGPDKEAVGQTAAYIEQLTRVPDKDERVFQDGVYITKKPGKQGV